LYIFVGHCFSWCVCWERKCRKGRLAAKLWAALLCEEKNAQLIQFTCCVDVAQSHPPDTLSTVAYKLKFKSTKIHTRLCNNSNLKALDNCATAIIIFMVNRITIPATFQHFREMPTHIRSNNYWRQMKPCGEMIQSQIGFTNQSIL